MSNQNAAERDTYWMSYALDLANEAEKCGEVPVGAVLVKDDLPLGQGWNQMISTSDPSAHAEVIALRSAAEYLQNYRLPDTTLYVTLEPCTMCFGVMIHARIARLVFGASEPKAGVVGSQLHLPSAIFFNHKIEVQDGVLQQQCAQKLTKFFSQRRKLRADAKHKLVGSD